MKRRELACLDKHGKHIRTYFFFFKAASAAILLCPAVFVSSQYWLALGLSSVFCFIFKDISEDIKCNVEAADFRDCMCIVH